MNLTRSAGQTRKPRTSADKDMIKSAAEMFQIMDLVSNLIIPFITTMCDILSLPYTYQVTLIIFTGRFRKHSMEQNNSKKPVVMTL